MAEQHHGSGDVDVRYASFNWDGKDYCVKVLCTALYIQHFVTLDLNRIYLKTREAIKAIQATCLLDKLTTLQYTAPCQLRPPTEHTARLSRDNTSLYPDWCIVQNYGAL